MPEVAKRAYRRYQCVVVIPAFPAHVNPPDCDTGHKPLSPDVTFPANAGMFCARHQGLENR